MSYYASLPWSLWTQAYRTSKKPRKFLYLNKEAETGSCEMTLISSLGVIAGVFLLVPKGVVVTVVLWGVAKVNPVLGVTLFGAWSLLERWL
jgi:hypothetical protein